jgi:hypothetical protein
VNDSSAKTRSPSSYDRWLVETARETIQRSRALLEQTEPLVRKSAPQIRPPGRSRSR